MGPSGPVDLTDLVVTSPSGKKVKLAGLVLDELGTYTLTVGGADGSVGHGKLGLKLKALKTKAVQHLADPALE